MGPSAASGKTPSQDADQSGHEGATIQNHQDGKSCNTDADQPELVGSGGGIDDAIGTGKKAANRDKKRKELKEQEKFEEDRFMRVDTNKKLKKKRKTTDFASSLDDLF